MEKVSITKISRFVNDKNGKQLVSKDGKPYERVNICTDKHGDKWLSGFGSSATKTWAVGDVVEIEVIQNGEYINFKTPKIEVINSNKTKELEVRILSLEERVSALESAKTINEI